MLLCHFLNSLLKTLSIAISIHFLQFHAPLAASHMCAHHLMRFL